MPSGFVTDNGKLPDNIKALVDSASYSSFHSVSPVFDPDPDPSTGLNNGGEGVLTLDQPQQQLMKGHRGFYLDGAAGGMYRDGWGTQQNPGRSGIDCPTVPTGAASAGNDKDDENHGWCVTRYGDGLYVDSYGMDGQLGPEDEHEYDEYGYEKDMAMQAVLEHDWTTDVTGSEVHIVNLSSQSIDFGTKLRASLLIYVNNGNDDTTQNGMWRRVTTDPTPDAVLLESGEEITVSFPTTNKIPVGEHLLVLVSEADGVAPSPDFRGVSIWPADTPKYFSSRVKFFPRGGVPDMTLTIR